MLTTIIATLILLGPTIFFHELGHFLLAKKAGIRVETFALGYGRKLFGFKKGETEYIIPWFPLIGGYVKLAGMDPSEITGAPWEFNSKSILQRLSVLVSGPLMHWLLAFLVFTAIFLSGVPDYLVSLNIQEVLKASPAQEIGLQPGDRIFKINGVVKKDFSELRTLITEHPGEKIILSIIHEGKEITKEVIPRLNPKTGKGEIGIAITPFPEKEIGVKKYNIFQAIERGVRQTINVTLLILITFWKLITLKISVRNLAGPLWIPHMAGEAARLGPSSFLIFFAFLNINVGIINLLPIPLLDGGHVLLLGIEKIKGSPLNDRGREIAQKIGIFIVAMLAALVFSNDINRWVQLKKIEKEKSIIERVLPHEEKAK
ncbi:Regulator of sigma-W protease RasP [subsurface metagenome]